jgi:putative FmdB family regulatory protein
MPIYEYRCGKCDHAFEQLVASMNGEHAVVCPQCGSRKVEKQLSVFSARQAESAPAHAPGPQGCHGCGQAGGCPFRE